MSIRAPFRSLFALAASALLVSSCARHNESAENASNSTNNAPPAATQAASTTPLTDANIAQIVLTANEGDIENAKYALRKTQSDAVKAFANQMITDHTSLNQQAKDLATRLNLTPEKNDTSHQLEESVETTRKGLDDKKGADFDKAYIDNEVTLHQNVLDMLDKTLIPGASNADLKSLLEKARPTIQAHLDHAKHVQSTLPPA